MDKKLNWRERAAIKILFFVVSIINPTGYTHQVDSLKAEIEDIVG